MIKAKTLIGCLLSLSLIVVFASNVESFDPEAISQVSKGIAEWKLINEDTSETQVEPKVYVSSSLSEKVKNSSRQVIGVVAGLSAFSSDYWNDRSFQIGNAWANIKWNDTYENGRWMPAERTIGGGIPGIPVSIYGVPVSFPEIGISWKDSYERGRYIPSPNPDIENIDSAIYEI